MFVKKVRIIKLGIYFTYVFLATILEHNLLYLSKCENTSPAKVAKIRNKDILLLINLLTIFDKHFSLNILHIKKSWKRKNSIKLEINESLWGEGKCGS